MLCLDCDHENLPGAELCEDCGQKLPEFQGTLTEEGREINEQIMNTPIAAIVKPESNQVIAPEATIRESLLRLRAQKAHLGALLVIDAKGEFLGVMTERDILLHVGDDPNCLDKMTVRDVYSRKRPVLSVEHSINYAVHQMAISGHRHLPITRDKQFIGFISVKDILAHLCKEISAL